MLYVCHLPFSVIIPTFQVLNHYITLKQTELNSALTNVTVNVTKEDMDEILTTVLTKISAECKDGGCIFTEPLQTMATESFGRD